MRFQKVLLALTALSTVATLGGPAQAAETATGVNNGDAGFINLSVTGPIAFRGVEEILGMAGQCTFTQQPAPFSNQSTVVVVGKGSVTAKDNSKVLGTAVRCALRRKTTSGSTQVYDHWDGLPGNAAVWAGTYSGEVGSFVICTQVKALLSSGEVVSQTFPCKEPSLP